MTDSRESIDARQHRADLARIRPRPLDTSTLGPIRVEPNAIAERARVVREALREIGATASLPFSDRGWACRMADASDETLAKLGRLLK